MRAVRFSSDRSGTVAILAAILSCVVLAVAALAIDVSRFYLVKRQQQMVSDLAAVAAAANIDSARAAALANLAGNGLPASDLVALDVGTYTADPSLPASQRFVAGASASNNAVRITLQSRAASFFAHALGPIAAAAPLITTRSIAANQNTADLALGSTLVSLDGGLANAVLGGLTGSQVSLSVLDYRSLGSATVDLFGLSQALAIRIGAGSIPLSSLATKPIRLSDLISAMADAASAAGHSPAGIAALRSLSASLASSGSRITLGGLVDYSVYGSLSVTAPQPVSAALPVLPFVTAAARLSAAGTGVIQATLGATVPGLLSANAKIVVGAPPIGSSYAGVGPTGTTLHTAQIRLLLTVQVQGLGGLTALNLPLYAEVAPATSRIASIACSGGNPVDPPVTLGVTPGIANAWIGSVSDASLSDTSSEPNPGPAVLTNLGLVAIWGRAQASVANLSETLVPFSSADIASTTPKTTATTDYTSSLLSRLFGSLQFSATVLGVSIGVPPTATATIAQMLQTALQPIDTELSNTLAMLGLTLGDATSWVGGLRCGGGSLVN